MIFDNDMSFWNWKAKYRYNGEHPLQTFMRIACAVANVNQTHYEATEDETALLADKFLKLMVKFEPAANVQRLFKSKLNVIGMEPDARLQQVDSKAEWDPEGELCYKDSEGNVLCPTGLKFTPGGRITANAGTEFGGTTLLNCFINAPVKGATIQYTMKHPILDDLVVKYSSEDTADNLMNIFITILELAETLKSEGGYGINFGFIRPRATIIDGVGIRHPGVVSYMEIWDKVSEIIVRGDGDGYQDHIKNLLKEEGDEDVVEKGQIRKGAMMAVLPIWHPDIEEFIRAKRTEGKLTKFNVSIGVDDAFMHAVLADSDYNLEFKGKVYKIVKAKDLYELVMKSTYDFADPGILYLDNMNRNNPIIYIAPNSATNPCVAAGTLVVTQKGLVPVENVKVGDMIQTTLGFGPVKEIECHRNHPVKKVTFSDGTSLIVTEGHIFHTKAETESRKKWRNDVRLKDLKVGTIVRKAPYKFDIKESGSSLDRSQGLFAGMLLGDGCANEQGRIRLAANGKEDNQFIRDLFSTLNLPIHEESTSDNGVRFLSQGKDAIEFAASLGLDLTKNAKDKTFSLQGKSKEFILGLVDGLICSDGNVNLKSRYPQIRFKSVNYDLHMLLREACLMLGVDYKVYVSGLEGEKGGTIDGRTLTRRHDIHEGLIDGDCILRLYEAIQGLSHPSKDAKFKEIVKTRQCCGTRWQTQIVSIEDAGIADVYDLYEENADDWNTEGIVSRGCGEIGGASYFDTQKKYAPYMQKWIDNFAATDTEIVGMTTVCLLGSHNLAMYVNTDREFDYAQYKMDVGLAALFLENINDIGNTPLPQYQRALKDVRQYGMGVNGLGSALVMLGIKYGSDEALSFVEDISRTKQNICWKTSAELASVRGPAPAYTPHFLETYWFENVDLDPEVKDLIRKHGVRNLKTTTNPPLGNSSVISNNVSNGCEPLSFFHYDRTSIVDAWPEGLNLDKLKELIEEGVFVVGTGRETSYTGTYAGRKFLYEPLNRGLCEIRKVYDYGWKWVSDNFSDEIESTYMVDSTTLTVDEHLNMQAAMQKYVDQSISKTIIVPNDYSYEEFKKAYMTAWRLGLNGCTTYRVGTLGAVISQTESADAPTASKLSLLEEIRAIDPQTEKTESGVIVSSVHLPDSYAMENMVTVKREGNKYYMTCSFLPNDTAKKHPIAFWILTNSFKTGEYVSMRRAVKALYDLMLTEGVNPELVTGHKDKVGGDTWASKLGKGISMCLRHNIDLKKIVENMEDIEDDHISTTLTAVRKFLKAKIEDGTRTGKTCLACGSQNVIYEGGCDRCLDCGSSGCN